MSHSRIIGSSMIALGLFQPALADTQAELEQLRKELDEVKQQVKTQPGETSSFNPNITLILSGTLADFKQDPESYTIPGISLGEETGPGVEGFSLAETELVMSANIDDHYFGRFTVALTPENEVEIEEAFIQTLALPSGFTLQAGRFYSELGYLNSKHAHQWDFVDQPLVYRAFLANQYNDDGLQLRWLAPTDTLFELGVEAFRGANYPAGGDSNSGKGTLNAFAKFGGDVGSSHSWSAGLSYLQAKADNRETNDGATIFNGDTTITAMDFIWKWAPQGNSYDQSLVLQMEVMQSEEQGSYNIGGSIDTTRHGAYIQAVYQFIHGWRAGLRYDRLDFDDPGSSFNGTELDPAGHSPSRSSIMFDYSHSEFSRWRLQYNRDESSAETDDQWFLQYTMSLGAHGAHRF